MMFCFVNVCFVNVCFAWPSTIIFYLFSFNCPVTRKIGQPVKFQSTHSFTIENNSDKAIDVRVGWELGMGPHK
jgi:hypothetical protein